MEKLINEFDIIVDDLIDEQQDSLTGQWYTTGHSNIGRVLAEEARKIAIEFAKWHDKFYNLDSKGLSYCKYELHIVQEGATYEQLFDKFLDEYYK